MTTLEVVEAVQRSLENEGFLQGIRAQLRANVLRIISSGPNYVSHSSKMVEFIQQRSGAASLYLVKDFLLKCGLRESLAVFEAEAGVQIMQEIDTDILLSDLGLQNNSSDCLLNCLIHNILNGNMKVVQNKLEISKSQDDYTHDEHSTQENISIQESESVSEEGGGEVYSAIDMEHKANHPPINLVGQKDQLSTIFSGFGRAQVDESSSFEADSPVKNLVGRHQPTEESFDEKSEINSSAEDKSLHVTGVRDSHTATEGKEMHCDEHGPEYESGQEEDVQFSNKLESPKRSYAAVVATVDSMKDVPVKEEEEEKHESETASLHLATEDDFDRLDRSSTLSGVSDMSSNRNRIAVRRAAAEGRDGSDPGSRSSSSRANIVRLNQASTSRSQTGWSSGEMQEADDFEELDNKEDHVDRRGENIANISMESRSFEEEGIESFPNSKHSNVGDVHRSNNQEDEEDSYSHGAKSGSDSEEDFEEEDFEEEENGIQSNFMNRNRPAFLSSDSPPMKQQSNQNGDMNPDEKDEDEEEYADDVFDADEDVDENLEMIGSSTKLSSPPKPAFIPSSRVGAGYGPSFKGSHDNAEEDDVESVEEEIEDEEDMMSVGPDSDKDSEDGDFQHIVHERAPARQQRPDDIQGLTRSNKSGALSTERKSPMIGSNFDAMLNSFEDSDEESEAGKPSVKSGITARMHEIDNQLEDMHRDDSTGELDKVRSQFEQRRMGDDESNSVASEDVDAMEFSTGEGHDGSDDSSGEGSFSFLDSSTKK